MALDLQQEIQRLAGMVQSGEITRETFQAQVQKLRAQAGTAGKQAVRQAVEQRVRQARPAQVIHRSGQIVESGPDVRAGFRNISLVLTVLALAVIAWATWGAARGDAPQLRMPSFEMPRIAIPDASQERRDREAQEPAQSDARSEPVGPEPRAFSADDAPPGAKPPVGGGK